MTLTLLLGLLACSGDDGDAKDSGPTGTATNLTFVTFNAGLARGFVPGSDSRQPDIATALGTVEADVVCLQEVWAADQVADVEATTLADYPHQFWPEPQQSSDAQCDDGTLDSMLSCFEDSCSDVCTDQVDDCLLDNCPIPFALLPRDCMRCAMANVGQDPDGLSSICEDAPVEFAYDGSFGTGILSKHPILSVQETVFASTSNRRSVLHAVIDAPDGELDVYCTHLTAAFDSIPYPRTEGNWVEEQRVQIEEMLALADSTAGEHAVLLGDMNTGPAINGMGAEEADNWELFADAEDWSIPYLEQSESDVQCTYCGDNVLVGASPDDDVSRVIDHILLRGFSEVVSTRRMLDGLDTTAESCGDVYDPSPLSDHYGVEVTATW
jgi:endonuclease/exonuclease/phosphatase family metal-dependent hydrolase